MSNQFDIIDQLLSDPVAGHKIRELRRRKTHEIVARLVDREGRCSVGCSCGLFLELPEALLETQGFTDSEIPWTYLRRDFRVVRELEDWFYCETGHIDHAEIPDARVFIVYFSTEDSPPDRAIWCSACKKFQPFRNGGGTYLYRPSAHTEQVTRHLEACSAIAEDDRLREWATLMWQATVSAQPGTKILGRPPLNSQKAAGDPTDGNAEAE